MYQSRSILPKFPEISEEETTDDQHEAGDDDSGIVHSVVDITTLFSFTMVRRNLASVDCNVCLMIREFREDYEKNL